MVDHPNLQDTMKTELKWNNNVKLIISDVDETVADLYIQAVPEMIEALEQLLREEKVLFFISGQSVQNIKERIIDHIHCPLRQKILVGHCSGAEVWGFNKFGDICEKPFYSYYDGFLTEKQKKHWRKLIKKLIEEFKLETFPVMSIPEFKKKSGNNPKAVIIDDRGPQITFEMINAHDLSHEEAKKLGLPNDSEDINYDLRIPIFKKAQKLFEESELLITPRLAGVFALDFAIKGVSKGTAVKYVIKNDVILSKLSLTKNILSDPNRIEVWGDKFSTKRGGTDRHISEALPKEVRSISFRRENPAEFLDGYNIQVWDGEQELHNGLLEFLKKRYL